MCFKNKFTRRPQRANITRSMRLSCSAAGVLSLPNATRRGKLTMTCEILRQAQSHYKKCTLNLLPFWVPDGCVMRRERTLATERESATKRDLKFVLEWELSKVSKLLFLKVLCALGH